MGLIARYPPHEKPTISSGFQLEWVQDIREEEGLGVRGGVGVEREKSA